MKFKLSSSSSLWKEGAAALASSALLLNNGGSIGWSRLVGLGLDLMTWGWILFVVIWNNINTKCIWIELNWNAQEGCLTQQLLLKPSCAKPSAGGDLEDRVWCGRLFGKLGRSDNFQSQKLCQLLLDQTLFSQRIYSQEQYLASQRVLEISSLLSLFKSDFNWYIIKPSIYNHTNNCLNFQWIFPNFHFS